MRPEAFHANAIVSDGGLCWGKLWEVELVVVMLGRARFADSEVLEREWAGGIFEVT